MLLRIFTLHLLVLLTACPADRLEDVDARGKAWKNERRTYGALSETDCKLRNGIWRGVKNAEYAVCDEIPRDAGTPCSDNKECEVFCSTKLAVKAGAKTSGICFNDFVQKACTQSISNGIANPQICK